MPPAPFHPRGLRLLGQMLIDQDVLHNEGVADFARYAHHNSAPLARDLDRHAVFDPDIDQQSTHDRG